MVVRIRALINLILLLAFGSFPVFGQRPDPNQTAINILKRLDVNRDGKLDPIEVPQKSKPAIAKLASEAGMDANKSLSIEKLIRQLEKSKTKSENKKEQRLDRKEPKRREREELRGDDNRGRGRDDERRDRRDDRKDSESSDSGSASKGFGSTNTSTRAQGFGTNSGGSLKNKYSDGVVKYVDRLLSRYDKNNNGYLDRSEWDGIKWSTDPKDSDLNKDGRLSKKELFERMDKRFNRGRSDRESKSGSSSSSKKKEPSTKSSSEQDKVRRYAEGLLRRYDKNKSGVLEKDEWGRLKGDPKEYDRNRDGVLNVDELAAKLGGFSSESSSSSSAKSRRPTASRSRNEKDRDGGRWSRYRSRSNKDAKDGESRKSYKVLTAHERLPSELSTRDREWFIQRDADRDGQIMMSEFATTWSQTKAKEFLEYDVNNDGVIVPSEMIDAEQD